VRERIQRERERERALPELDLLNDGRCCARDGAGVVGRVVKVLSSGSSFPIAVMLYQSSVD
jgi:hypothetical protein